MNKSQKIVFGLVAVVLVAAIAVATIFQNAGQNDGTVSGTQSDRNGDVIKIGAILPLTGGAGTYVGNQALQGINFAVDTINDNGGINGRKIVVIVEDGMQDVKASVSAFNKLRNIERINAVITVASPASYATAEYLRDNPKDGCIQIATFLTPVGFTSISENTYRLNFDASQEAKCLVSFLALKKIKTAVFYRSDDEYGHDLSKEFAAQLKENGIVLKGEQAYSKEQTDHKQTLEQLKQIHADVVMFIGNDQTVPLAMKQGRQLQIQGLFTGTAASLSSPDYWKLGGIGCQNAYYATVKYDSLEDSERTERDIVFRKRYKEKKGNIPNFLVAFPFATMEFLELAISNANKITPNDISQSIHKIKEFDSVLGHLTVQPNRDVFTDMCIMQIIDGSNYRVDMATNQNDR